MNILDSYAQFVDVRAPFKGEDYFCSQVNANTQKVEQAYLETIKPAIAMQKASAMLGDGTVTQVDTFDPQDVQLFYQRLASSLEGWTFSGISKSATEDLHRVYCQFTKEVDKYYISGYFGVQFHVLPYYRVHKRVIDIQKELAKIADDATTVFNNMTGAADKALASELEKRGYASLEFQELFTKMFDDEKLVQELDEKASAVESQFPEFGEMGERKTRLFAELNDLLIELYQTSPVLIDYNRLMQGEEGVTIYFDIELVKNKKTKAREAFLNTGKIKEDDTNAVSDELDSIAKALKKVTLS
ncbi:MAG TPA: hypothetical protein VGQ13_05250 [Nitrososphaera sp.]|jgi:hypothetical protein|nr:hypothetical protein [Nitrososphaera sp.]